MFVPNRSYGKDIWVSIPIWFLSLPACLKVMSLPGNQIESGRTLSQHAGLVKAYFGLNLF